MNEKLKPLISLIGLSIGIIILVFFAAYNIVSVTEEPIELDRTIGPPFINIVYIFAAGFGVAAGLFIFSWLDEFVSNRRKEK